MLIYLIAQHSSAKSKSQHILIEKFIYIYFLNLYYLRFHNQYTHHHLVLNINRMHVQNLKMRN